MIDYFYFLRLGDPKIQHGNNDFCWRLIKMLRTKWQRLDFIKYTWNICTSDLSGQKRALNAVINTNVHLGKGIGENALEIRPQRMNYTWGNCSLAP